MKKTDTELDRILDRLIASTRSPYGRYSANESYKLIEKQIQGGRKRIFKLQYAMKAAAAVLLLGVLSWCFYEYALPPQMLTVKTLAECVSVDLSDGSQVKLNRYSSLTYPKQFRKSTRLVKLNGEGYFVVEKNADKPFIVDLEEVLVEVLGTRFNVEGYRNNPDIITTLYQGSVAVSTPSGDESLILKPKE